VGQTILSVSDVVARPCPRASKAAFRQSASAPGARRAGEDAPCHGPKVSPCGQPAKRRAPIRAHWPAAPPLPMNPYAQLIELTGLGHPFCAAVVLETEGSTPREAGTRAAITGDGRIYGTIGGGLVEAEAQRQAPEACRLQQPTVLQFDLTNEVAAGEGAICGGRVWVLLDPTAAKDRASYVSAAEALRDRRRGVLITSVGVGAGRETQVTWLSEADAAEAWRSPVPVAPEAVQASLGDGRSRLMRGGEDAAAREAEVLIEPVVPQPLLVIAGGGHVGQALAAQAVLVGFEVIVVDDRPAFTAADLFPDGVQTRCGDIAALVAAHATGSGVYVVIVTRGHEHDAAALRACIGRPLAYLGMIGSRRKIALLRESFLQGGVATAEQFDAVHAPIGLDIGAETVPEIAASIAAELVAVRRGRWQRRQVGRAL